MPLVNNKFLPIELPPKHARVLLDTSKNWRYRCLYGGRNGAKDWSACAVAIETAVRVLKRFLCTREVQKTIRDSIHQLLVDTIKRLGYSEYFKITDKDIKCLTTGSNFIFTGLRDLSASNLKSLEGIDICILGEAENITEKSFSILDPTLRKKGSEVWIIYNPQLENDFIYQFTVVDPPNNLISEKVNFLDIPRAWVSDEIWTQIERMKANNSEAYNHIWLGETGTGGKFFHEFGPHLKEKPFILHEDSYLYGSLDHGTTAPTSFGLWWKDSNKKPHRLWTYYEPNRATSTNALKIALGLQAFKWTQYKQPHMVFYDPSMKTKMRLEENFSPSPIDYYEKAFEGVFNPSNNKNARKTIFVPANNDIPAGCDLMREMFSVRDGVPNSFYWPEFNQPYEKLIPAQQYDPYDDSKYNTRLEDHIADDARYGFMGMMGSNRKSVDKPNKSEYIHNINPYQEKYSQLQRATNLG